MYCRKCGHELEDEACFCSHCGAEVKPLASSGAVAAGDAKSDVPVESSDAPVSLKAAMDETKERSKRRIPRVVLVVLAVVLVAAIALASYFIYSSAAQQPEDQSAQIDAAETSEEESGDPAEGVIEEESEETPESESEAEPEAEPEEAAEEEEPDSSDEEAPPAEPEEDPVTAAYEGILEEYRNCVAYFDGGGDINDLELDPATSMYVEYPDVNVIGFMDFANREGAYVQYAYADLNDDAIDELLIRSNEPDLSSVTIIQGFTYYDGEVKELFESTYRNQWHIEDNGYLLLTADSGGDTYGQTICMVDPAAENGRRLVESIMFEYEDGYDRMNDDSPYRVTRETPEGTEEFTVTYTEMQEMTSDFGSEYTSGGEEIVLDWQDL